MSGYYAPNHANQHVISEITALSACFLAQEGHHYPIQWEGDDLQHPSSQFPMKMSFQLSPLLAVKEEGNPRLEGQQGKGCLKKIL